MHFGLTGQFYVINMYILPQLLKNKTGNGTSQEVWWLRLCLSNQGVQVQSQGAKILRAWWPKNQHIKKKNKFNKDDKMVHIKKKTFKEAH